MIDRSDAEILRASRERGHVGGGYYDPPDEFLAMARRLGSPLIEWFSEGPEVELTLDGKPTYLIAQLFRELTSRIRRDELLFAVYDNRRYRMAVFVPTEERLMDFEQQIVTGKLRRVGFFALAARQAEVGLIREFVQ